MIYIIYYNIYIYIYVEQRKRQTYLVYFNGISEVNIATVNAAGPLFFKV